MITANMEGGHNNRRKRRRRALNMKRRARVEGCRRPANEFKRKVRNLRKLIPNANSEESVGFEGLFRMTADYILALQMRVKVMQIMVKVLSVSDD